MSKVTNDHLSFLKQKEYENLNTEHNDNRSLMFERPLLIIAAITAILQINIDEMQIVLPILLILPVINLWFTANRLSSDARIIAYIQVFHEGIRQNRWIGWESALVHYRKWMDKEENRKNPEILDFCAKIQTARFYKIIWWIHFSVIFFLLLIILKVVLEKKLYCPCNWLNDIELFIFVLLTVISVFITIWLVIDNRPNKYKDIIIVEMSRWISVSAKKSWTNKIDFTDK